MVINPDTDRGAEGFVATDALVGLTIMALSIALTMKAADVGYRLSRLANEATQATIVGASLINDPSEIRATSGQTRALRWTISGDEGAGGSSAPKLCTRRVRLQSSSTGRTYIFSGERLCLPPSMPRNS